MDCHATHMLGLAQQVNSHQKPSEELHAALVILLSMVKSIDPAEVSAVVEKAMIEYRSRSFN